MLPYSWGVFRPPPREPPVLMEEIRRAIPTFMLEEPLLLKETGEPSILVTSSATRTSFEFRAPGSWPGGTWEYSSTQESSPSFLATSLAISRI